MNAQIEINFSAEGAFVFHATGLRARRLQNLSEVSDAISVHYREGTWRKEWMLVEACHEATHATIIVSQDDLAAIVLSAKADSLIPAISLANPKLKLAVSSSRGKLLRFCRQTFHATSVLLLVYSRSYFQRTICRSGARNRRRNHGVQAARHSRAP